MTLVAADPGLRLRELLKISFSSLFFVLTYLLKYLGLSLGTNATIYNFFGRYLIGF